MPETVGPQARTAVMAEAVEQCSRMMRRFGKCVCRDLRVGRNEASALRIVIAGFGSVVGLLLVGGRGALEGVEGTSPWRLRIMLFCSMAAKMG